MIFFDEFLRRFAADQQLAERGAAAVDKQFHAERRAVGQRLEFILQVDLYGVVV